MPTNIDPLSPDDLKAYISTHHEMDYLLAEGLEDEKARTAISDIAQAEKGHMGILMDALADCATVPLFRHKMFMAKIAVLRKPTKPVHSRYGTRRMPVISGLVGRRSPAPVQSVKNPATENALEEPVDENTMRIG